MTLPEPECPLGYPKSQLDTIFGDDVARLWQWMRGQTGAICTGTRYNHDTGAYELSPCAKTGAHGYVVYRWDVERFMVGGPILD